MVCQFSGVARGFLSETGYAYQASSNNTILSYRRSSGNIVRRG